MTRKQQRRPPARRTLDRWVENIDRGELWTNGEIMNEWNDVLDVYFPEAPDLPRLPRVVFIANRLIDCDRTRAPIYGLVQKEMCRTEGSCGGSWQGARFPE